MDYAIKVLVEKLAIRNTALNDIQRDIETGCSRFEDMQWLTEKYQQEKKELEEALTKLEVF